MRQQGVEFRPDLSHLRELLLDLVQELRMQVAEPSRLGQSRLGALEQRISVRPRGKGEARTLPVLSLCDRGQRIQSIGFVKERLAIVAQRDQPGDSSGLLGASAVIGSFVM